MGVQKERKSTFLTAFEQREKEARGLFAAQYWYLSCVWMSLSSESSVSNKIPRYLYWSTAFTHWPPNFKTGVAVLFARLEWRRTKALGVQCATGNSDRQRLCRCAGYHVGGRTVRKQVHRVESRMEYYWELRSKKAQNIKAQMCPL